jgi:hypothetical protein
VDNRFLADDLPRQTQAIGGQLQLSGVLGRKAEQVGGGDPSRENCPLPDGQGANSGYAGKTGSESRLPRTVVEPLAQPAQLPLAGEARECLRDGRERQAGKVG